MMNARRLKNNAASLWQHKDGSVCGFRLVWVPGMRDKLLIDQKFPVLLSGRWAQTGEILLSGSGRFATDGSRPVYADHGRSASATDAQCPRRSGSP